MTTTTTSQAPAEAAVQPAKGRKKKSDIRILAGFSHVALVVWAIAIIAPLIWVLLSSFKDTGEIFSSPWTMPDHLRWENWARAWDKAHIGQYFLNTVFIVGASTFGTMLLGSMAAYVLARYKFVGNRAVYFLFVSGLAFPVFIALIPLFFVVKQLGLAYTQTGLILVYIAYSLPFTIFFLSAFFKTLPHSVAEAAMIDGAGHWKLFFRVMLPMAKPGLISITIFNVIGQWAQYILPLYLLGDYKDKWVLTQGIADISVNAGYEADWSGLFAALTIAILPMIFVYALMQRQIQAGLTAGAVK